MFKNLLSSMLFGICNGLRPVASNHGISVGQFALSQISTYKVMWGNSSTLINVITPIKKPLSSLTSDATGSKLLEVYNCVATPSVNYGQKNVVRKK